MKDQIIHISLADIDFTCPHCNKPYDDKDDKYLNICNKNKCGYTKIKCDCGHTFGVIYNYKGNAVGFKLNNKNTIYEKDN